MKDLDFFAKPFFTGVIVLLCLSCGGEESGPEADADDADGIDDGQEDVLAEDGDPAADPLPDADADGPLDDLRDAPDEEEIELPPGGYEARGLWVTRWNYSSLEDIETIVAHMAASGFNQIYFQIRGTADAYYASNHEPWAARLSGTLGQDPGWDPLAAAVESAHASGIEVHAWMNSFPMWSGSSPPPDSEPEHIYTAHPEWICADVSGTPMPLGSDYVFGSPGNPALQDHIAAVAADIADNYDVDGIHLDYIRYPGPEYCYDTVSEARYAEALAAEPGLERADWQRRQVNETVSKVFEAVTAVRPEAAVSAAVWGIYRNTWGWSAVSKGYDDYFQDPRAWTAGGYIDALCPMIYWSIKPTYGERTDFAALLDDHVAGNPDRHVYAGMYGDYDDFAEIAAEIDYGRGHDAAGFVIFAYSYIEEHAYWDDLAEGPLALQALVPPMEWK